MYLPIHTLGRFEIRTRPGDVGRVGTYANTTAPYCYLLHPCILCVYTIYLYIILCVRQLYVILYTIKFDTKFNLFCWVSIPTCCIGHRQYRQFRYFANCLCIYCRPILGNVNNIKYNF